MGMFLCSPAILGTCVAGKCVQRWLELQGQRARCVDETVCTSGRLSLELWEFSSWSDCVDGTRLLSGAKRLLTFGKGEFSRSSSYNLGVAAIGVAGGHLVLSLLK